jgi:peptide/nickel transport system substrate-binding protein
MPDNPMAPSLATTWHESPDGLTYGFELRQGVKFHNGAPVTAEDVKFSFERYKGTGTPELKGKIKAVEIVTPHRVRFQLHEPWPDSLTFYATPATGVGWIVPQNYTEKIGSEKFKEQPVGLGPYRFVSYLPGVELVLEANTDYWRRVPHVKRLVLKSVPDGTTRLAMLKKQEADVAFGLWGTLGEAVRRDPNLKLEPVVLPVTQWVVFTYQQYDPRSPWSDKRVRLAANHAINRQPSTRQRHSDTRSQRGALSRASSTGPCPWSPTRTIPRKPGNSSPRPDTPRASRLGTVRSTAFSLASGRQLWTT